MRAAAKQTSEPLPDELSLRVFGYREDDAWVALALEMDLRGYGRTFKQALEELRDLVNTQVSFALFKNQPEMIWRSAEPVWFSRYEEARKELLQARLRRRPAKTPDTEVAAMPIPPDELRKGVIAAIIRRFRLPAGVL